jgi:hypothetical protein
MKTRVAVLLTILVALLFAVSGCSAKVVRVLKDEGYTATFYDSKCENEKVKAIAAMVGVPTAITQSMRAGEVTFTDGTPARQFCYKDSNSGDVTFIVDDTGSMGNLSLRK